jgi:hypothetical protein
VFWCVAAAVLFINLSKVKSNKPPVSMTDTLGDVACAGNSVL